MESDQRVRRPWGEFRIIDSGQGYQVKRITVNPGGVLSLQKHLHRAERWVVARGEAEVTVESNRHKLSVGGAAHIPRGSIHRLANRGKEPLILIEVQTGDYLGEDDIIRFEDIYDRQTQPVTGRPEEMQTIS